MSKRVVVILVLVVGAFIALFSARSATPESYLSPSAAFALSAARDGGDPEPVPIEVVRPKREFKPIPRRRSVFGAHDLAPGEKMLKYAPRSGDMCDAREFWRDSPFLVHPPRDLVRPGVDDIMRVLPDPILDAWLTPFEWRDPALRKNRAPRVNTKLLPAELLRSNGTTEQLQGCARKFAVIGVARGYDRFTISPYYKSFQEYRDRCTVMHAFVDEKPDEEAFDMQSPGIVFEDYNAYLGAAAALLPDLKFKSRQNGEVMRLVFLLMFLPKYRDFYSGFISADTRDMLFMADPFVSLQEQFAFARAGGGEYFFVLNEDFTVEPIPQYNMGWIKGLTNDETSDMLQYDVRIKGHSEWLFALNSGLIGGTAQALIDMSDLMIQTLLRGPGDETGYDQGAMNIVVYLGLEIANFPHRVYVLQPSASPFRHLYRDAHKRRVGARERHLNCYDKPYAMVHQWNRWVDMYNDYNKRYTGSTLCAKVGPPGWRAKPVKDRPPFVILGGPSFDRTGQSGAVLSKELTDVAMALNFTDILLQQQQQQRLAPVELLSVVNIANGEKVSCLPKVVVWASNPSSNDDADGLRNFAKAFLATARECSFLAILGRDRSVLDAAGVGNVDGIVLFFPEITIRSGAVGAGPFQQHQDFVDAHGSRFARILLVMDKTLRPLMFADAFSSTTFVELDKQFEAEPYVFLVREAYFLGFIKGEPGRVNSEWITAVAGGDGGVVMSIVRRWLDRFPGHAAPVVSYDAIGGHPVAVAALLKGVAAIIATPAARGMELAPSFNIFLHSVVHVMPQRFPFHLVLTDEALGTLRSMYRAFPTGDQSIIWDGDNGGGSRHLNCRNEPYALVTQMGWYGGAYERSMKAFADVDWRRVVTERLTLLRLVKVNSTKART